MKNVLTTLKGLSNCSRFYNLVKRAKLEGVFAGKKLITVFVPTNKGCDCLEDDEILEKDVKKLVSYHVVSGKISQIDLVPYKLRTTLHGKQVCLEAASVTVNASLIIRKDIECANGTIHLIDRILVPKNVSCKPTTNYFLK